MKTTKYENTDGEILLGFESVSLNFWMSSPIVFHRDDGLTMGERERIALDEIMKRNGKSFGELARESAA